MPAQPCTAQSTGLTTMVLPPQVGQEEERDLELFGTTPGPYDAGFKHLCTGMFPSTVRKGDSV